MLNDSHRVRALPVWGAGAIPPERDRSAENDGRGFADVVRIFLRTWPYLAPMVLGYWRERDLGQWPRGSGGVAAPSNESAWSYRYVPFLASGAVLIGPSTDWLPLGLDWQRDLLVWATAAMAFLSWLLVFVRGRPFAAAAVALVLLGISANLFAILAVSGWQDDALVGLVSLACLGLWLFQYRIANGRLRIRLRLGCHLVYYYGLICLNMLVGIVTGLFTIDLLNQSILQAQPLTPFLADFVGQPELKAGVVETLSTAQRQELQWIYIVFLVANRRAYISFRRRAAPTTTCGSCSASIKICGWRWWNAGISFPCATTAIIAWATPCTASIRTALKLRPSSAC